MAYPNPLLCVNGVKISSKQSCGESFFWRIDRAVVGGDISCKEEISVDGVVSWLPTLTTHTRGLLSPLTSLFLHYRENPIITIAIKCWYTLLRNRIQDMASLRIAFSDWTCRANKTSCITKVSLYTSIVLSNKNSVFLPHLFTYARAWEKCIHHVSIDTEYLITACSNEHPLYWLEGPEFDDSVFFQRRQGSFHGCKNIAHTHRIPSHIAEV